MSNVIPLPLPTPAVPPVNISVMNETFVHRLAAANALTRKLRGWRVDVENVVIPPSHENAPAMLYIRPDPTRSAKQLLDATAGSRRWHPASGRLPDRMVADLDGCMVMWILRDRRTLLRRTERGCT